MLSILLTLPPLAPLLLRLKWILLSVYLSVIPTADTFYLYSRMEQDKMRVPLTVSAASDEFPSLCHSTKKNSREGAYVRQVANWLVGGKNKTP